MNRRAFLAALLALPALPALAQLVNPGAPTFAQRDGLIGPTWSPLDLGPSLLAWWDAERPDLITRDGSGFVSSWRDVVAGYDVTQPTAGLQPVYGATSFGGRPGITSDGVDDVLTLAPVPAAFPIGAAGSELWAAMDQTALPADVTIRVATGYGFASATNRYLARTVGSGINRGLGTFGDGTVQKASLNSTVDLTGRHAVRAALGPAAVQADVDGIAGPSVAGVPATTNNFLRIFGGSASTSTSLFQGGLNLVLVTLPLAQAQADNLAYFVARRIGP